MSAPTNIPEPTRAASRRVESVRNRLSLHGLAVELICSSRLLGDEIHRLFKPFTVSGWPPGVLPTRGFIRRYDQSEVARHLSPSARRINGGNEPVGLYQDGERFWTVDDRLGLCEINLLKNQWRTWLLPQPRVDTVRCAEFAVLWPMAQLLRSRGLHLLPAPAVTRGGKGMLILSATGIEAELATLLSAGYRLIGQRWTAVREEAGRIDLLHLPGRVPRPLAPRLQLTVEHTAPAGSSGGDGQWIDLAAGRCSAEQNHAFCDTVLLVQRGRRANATLSRLDGEELSSLRAGWPIIELHPQRRVSALPAQLAKHCACWQACLSRRPTGLLEILPATQRSGSTNTHPHIAPRTVRAA